MWAGEGGLDGNSRCYVLLLSVIQWTFHINKPHSVVADVVPVWAGLALCWKFCCCRVFWLVSSVRTGGR